MVAFTAVCSVVAFLFAFWISGIVPKGRRVLSIARESLALLRDDGFDDERREQQLQQASMVLFGLFLSMLIRTAFILVITCLPIFLAGVLNVAEANNVIAFISQWDFIVLTTIVVCLVYAAWGRLRPPALDGFQIDYSTLDRLLHHLAFTGKSIQFTAVDLENNLFSSEFESIEAEKPIFITSLPRAGTTLCLNVLNQFPSLATHTYRDMPFILAPILWSKLSRPFHKQDKQRERAHGDGVTIGYDSPEAFEEIIWRSFWPEKYSHTGIALWDATDIRLEANAFFCDHMKKIIALRGPANRIACRYVSKNNGNIARLDILKEMFPDANILLPIRNPRDHAASLLRQHHNFHEMHRNNPFIRRYMADIGHYEFGALMRPICFPALRLINNRDPFTLDYWLAYWIAAYEHVLEKKDRVIIISYEAICSAGETALAEICAQLNIPEDGMLPNAAAMFRSPVKHRINNLDFDDKLLARAEELYKLLMR
jgi:hypothetical protein